MPSLWPSCDSSSLTSESSSSSIGAYSNMAYWGISDSFIPCDTSSRIDVERRSKNRQVSGRKSRRGHVEREHFVRPDARTVGIASVYPVAKTLPRGRQVMVEHGLAKFRVLGIVELEDFGSAVHRDSELFVGQIGRAHVRAGGYVPHANGVLARAKPEISVNEVAVDWTHQRPPVGRRRCKNEESHTS